MLDDYVSGWVLKALEPAALALSLEAASNLQRERDDLNQLWQERLQRSTYEADRAERQYHLVEPENRLLARRLEREWEEKLEAHQRLQEDYDRFLHTQPRTLSEEETRAIRRLSADIPALWEAPTTTPADRKQIIRQVVERVVVDAYGQSERVRARIEWAGGGGGGSVTQGELIRQVASYEQLSYWPQLYDRVRLLAQEGLTAGQIAEDLNAQGYKPPKRSEVFRAQGVRELMRRVGLSRREVVHKGSQMSLGSKSGVVAGGSGKGSGDLEKHPLQLGTPRLGEGSSRQTEPVDSVG